MSALRLAVDSRDSLCWQKDGCIAVSASARNHVSLRSNEKDLADSRTCVFVVFVTGMMSIEVLACCCCASYPPLTNGHSMFKRVLLTRVNALSI
jgi:hypothetical protein